MNYSLSNSCFTFLTFITKCCGFRVNNSECVFAGTEAGSLVKRDVKFEVDRIAKVINDMSASITTATKDLVEKVKALEVTNTAQ